jgi:hypothetical protein
MDNVMYKYLKYKNKYNSLKKSFQKGGSNLRMNRQIYLHLQNNVDPCLEHFGVDLDVLETMAGKDRSSHGDTVIGTSRININGVNMAVALKTFNSSCNTKKIGDRIVKIYPDIVSFTHEILICKELTEKFLLTGILQNIVWFYNGGVCGFSYDTPISKCSGPKLPITGDHKIYRQFGNTFMDEKLNDYLQQKNTEGDASGFMIVEKCTGSLNGIISKIINENKILDVITLNIIMSIILQTILTLNYLNNELSYFMHTDLHPGNLLYTVTTDETITYDLNFGPITLRTFNNLAKIWDFGESLMEPIDTILNESEGNYKIDKYEYRTCIQDIYSLMFRFKTDFIDLLTPINKQNLDNPRVLEIFNDINTMIEIYISQPILYKTDTIPKHKCIEDNRFLANLIFQNPTLLGILMKYTV